MPRVPEPKTVIAYQDINGVEPLTQWLNKLRDIEGRNRIFSRLRMLEYGHYGDYASVGDKVMELRFFFGPGYRVYFAEDGNTLVLLLCGGDKSSQEKDIRLAKAYWKEYQARG